MMSSRMQVGFLFGMPGKAIDFASLRRNEGFGGIPPMLHRPLYRLGSCRARIVLDETRGGKLTFLGQRTEHDCCARRCPVAGFDITFVSCVLSSCFRAALCRVCRSAPVSRADLPMWLEKRWFRDGGWMQVTSTPPGSSSLNR